MSTVAERVAAGAAYLDEHEPGWVDRIDLEQLSLSSCWHCVLGQLHGSFLSAPIIRAMEGCKHGSQEWNERQAVVRSLGFATKNHRDYPALTVEWRRLIDARRAQAGAAS